MVDVAELVREVAATLGAQGGERVRVTTDPDVATIVAGRSELRLVLRCLLDNALRYSGPDQPVDVTARREDEHVVMDVRDRGSGMGREEARRAFRPFAQQDTETAGAEGGLGMGLFASRRLVERLGGELRLLPPPGRGLVVQVRLPQRREGDARGRPRTT